MDIFNIIILILAGGVAGFINTIAGSGSLITLPLLMFMGLDANVANGTNRIAILLQNVVGVKSFHNQKLIDKKNSLKLLLPSVVGSIVGANLAIELNETIMKQTIAGLLIIMFFIILFKPEKWVKSQAGEVKAKSTFFQWIVFFAIGVYGGFIQAGVGFFLLSGLVLSVGYDLIRANAMKLLIVLAYTPIALLIFIFHEQINYTLGFILAIGNMIGAYIAAKFASKIGAKYIRYILLAIILVSAFKLLNIYSYL
ncbi:MAG: sulfite exporter TauE/SafE family protein [Bacteroidales bacterium]|nr:sulfite exporter TauE/SafE family protein [Bacteroidales bacterium]